jgi:hypothetical protein
LGETGHGLVVSGRKDELIDDSPAANVYGTKFIYARVGLIYFLIDVIKIKFPWYRRMHNLMGSSSVVSRKAVCMSPYLLSFTIDPMPSCSSSIYRPYLTSSLDALPMEKEGHRVITNTKLASALDKLTGPLHVLYTPLMYYINRTLHYTSKGRKQVHGHFSASKACG